MFKELTTFSYRRNPKEATGFYLAYLLVGFLLGGVFGGLSALTQNTVNFEEAFQAGAKIGAIVGTLYCAAISCMVLLYRRLHTNLGYILLALVGIIASFFGGALLGLIVPAFLTTRDAEGEGRGV